MRVFGLILIVILIAAIPYTAFAHGSEAHVELNVTQASPGATIDVRGSGFEPGDTTTIMFVGAERQVLLGSATTDDHGDLRYTVLLPMDLVNGVYEVRVADMHQTVAAPLNIVPDSNGDEEGSQRGEDEPLLVPMPAQPVRTVPTSSTSTPIATRSSTEAAPPVTPTLLLSSGVALVVLVVGLVVISRRSR